MARQQERLAGKEALGTTSIDTDTVGNMETEETCQEWAGRLEVARSCSSPCSYHISQIGSCDPAPEVVVLVVHNCLEHDLIFCSSFLSELSNYTNQ